MSARDRHPDVAARQAELDELRRQTEERAQCIPLEWHAWYSTHTLASLLGINRPQLRAAFPELTTRQGEGYNAPHEIRADERLEDLCRRWYINVRIGEREPTLARWHGAPMARRAS